MWTWLWLPILCIWTCFSDEEGLNGGLKPVDVCIRSPRQCNLRRKVNKQLCSFFYSLLFDDIFSIYQYTCPKYHRRLTCLGCASHVLLCSILVRSLDWAQLKPNLAWLVDAGVCVVLDIFVSYIFAAFDQIIMLHFDFWLFILFCYFISVLYSPIFFSVMVHFLDQFASDSVPVRVLLLEIEGIRRRIINWRGRAIQASRLTQLGICSDVELLMRQYNLRWWRSRSFPPTDIITLPYVFFWSDHTMVGAQLYSEMQYSRFERNWITIVIGSWFFYGLSKRFLL